MPHTATNNATKSRRLNVAVSFEIAERTNNIAEFLNSTVSDVVRTALIEFIRRNESIRLEQALKEGYKANSSYYSQMSKEWEHADVE